MNLSFEPFWPFTLNWRVSYSDLQLEMGHITFDHVTDAKSFVGDETENADDDTIRVVASSGNWKSVVPVFVNEMVFNNEPDRLGVIQTAVAPAYDTASFWLSGETPGIYAYWGVPGRGFGQIYITCPGGNPTVSNESLSKDSLIAVLNHLTIPNRVL